MDLKLKGKRALVTASTGGIGKAIAKKLLEEGAFVYIHGSRESSVEKALNDLRDFSSNISGIAANLKENNGCETLIKGVDQPLDILVNNFGIYETVDFFETTDELWQEYFESNVQSGVRLSRHFLKPMLERNWGRVLFISSESGLNIPEDMIHYGFSKTAQLSIMRGLAKLTKGTNVTVNAILPGPTYTSGVEEFMKNIAKDLNIPFEELKKSFVKEHRPSSLLQRFAEEEEVANMTTFICSPLASLTNGSSIKVEGGIINQIN